MLENPRTSFHVEEHFNFIGKFGHNSRMRRFDLINGSNWTSFGKSMSLSRVRLINDEASRFRHVAREEEASRFWSSSDDRDESTCPSRAFNLDRYNSPDQLKRLHHFKLNRRIIRCRHVPLRVSDIRRMRFNRAIRHLSLHHVTCNWKQASIVPHGINFEI